MFRTSATPAFSLPGLYFSCFIPCSAWAWGKERLPAPRPYFFSLVIAYIIPVFRYITARAEEALTELDPFIPASTADLQSMRTRLSTVSLRVLLPLLLSGALAGLGHLSFIRGSVFLMFEELTTDPTAFISTVGTVLVWLVMTTVTYMLVQQAVIFARLGAEVRISLLNTQALLPFGRVATYSSIAIIGALAMFPLMSVDSRFLMAEGLPGAIAMTAPLLIIFVIPVWPVHRRLHALKTEELKLVTARIEASRGSDLALASISELAPLLVYRREITQVSTWPFDLGSVTRLFLYLVIVPLTWAGAALIERLVDVFV